MTGPYFGIRLSYLVPLRDQVSVGRYGFSLKRSIDGSQNVRPDFIACLHQVDSRISRRARVRSKLLFAVRGRIDEGLMVTVDGNRFIDNLDGLGVHDTIS